jgi:hypothetical protein
MTRHEKIRLARPEARTMLGFCFVFRHAGRPEHGKKVRNSATGPQTTRLVVYPRLPVQPFPNSPIPDSLLCRSSSPRLSPQSDAGQHALPHLGPFQS